MTHRSLLLLLAVLSLFVQGITVSSGAERPGPAPSLLNVLPQTDPPAPSWEGKVIRTLDVEPARYAGEVTLRPNDQYDTETIRTLLKTLYRQGDFRDIRLEVTPLDDDQIALKLIFVPRLRLASIAISGNHFIPTDDILAALDIAPGAEWTDAVWVGASARLTAYFKGIGYFQATATPRVTPLRPATPFLPLLPPVLGNLIESIRPSESAGDVPSKVTLQVEIREGDVAHVRALHFNGKGDVSDLLLSWHLRLQKREPFNQAELARDVERLKKFYRKRGHLLVTVQPPDVFWDARTNEVTITHAIAPSHRVRLFFDGRGPFSESRLEEQIEIVDAQSDDNAVLQRSARALERFYAGHGYPFAKVVVAVARVAEENHVRFQIDAGPRARIRTVSFPGRRSLSKDTLREAILLRREGTLETRIYTEAQRDADAEAIRQRYRREGFSEVQVTGEAAFDTARENVDLRFRIVEGVQTRIAEIRLEGNADLAAEEIMPPGLLHQPYHEGAIKNGARHLQSAYARAGYLYATVEPEVAFSGDKTETRVRYKIVEGKPVRLGSVLLEGNLRTRDFVVRREIGLRSGDPYNPEAILKSQGNLYRAGYFSSVRFTPIGIEAEPERLDVQLSVAELPHVPVAFGFGYGEHERMRGFFEVSDRNVWGLGQEIRLHATASALEEKYTLSFREPWPFGHRLNTRVALSTGNQREITYDLDTVGATAGVEKEFGDAVKGTLQYQYERNHIRPRDPAALLSPEDVGRLNIATINLSLVRDTRDDPFDPTRGTVSWATLRNGAKAIGSEVQFSKLTLQHNRYRAISPRLIIAFSARVGAAERFGETDLIPPTERFLLGGRNTVRGYRADRIGLPGETSTLDGKPIGGNAFLVFNEELRVRIKRAFGLVFFFDHGNVWREIGTVRLSEIKTTTGIGLRYHTPVGPLRIDWGYKLDRADGESPSELHFTLGHAF